MGRGPHGRLNCRDITRPERSRGAASAVGTGELEITDLDRPYMEAGGLNIEIRGRGLAWLRTGTHESLIQAGEFVRTIEHRPGPRIGCVEATAFHDGRIDAACLLHLARRSKSGYAAYLRDLASARAGAGGRFSR